MVTYDLQKDKVKAAIEGVIVQNKQPFFYCQKNMPIKMGLIQTWNIRLKNMDLLNSPPETGSIWTKHKIIHLDDNGIQPKHLFLTRLTTTGTLWHYLTDSLCLYSSK